MVVGVIMFIVAILAVFIGTRDSEARVLYYDAEYSQNDVGEETESVDDAPEDQGDFVQDGLGGQQSVVSERPRQPKQSQQMSVKVGGSAVKKKGSATDSLESIRQAASDNDPNAAAQELFDSIKEGRL